MKDLKIGFTKFRVQDPEFCFNDSHSLCQINYKTLKKMRELESSLYHLFYAVCFAGVPAKRNA